MCSPPALTVSTARVSGPRFVPGVQRKRPAGAQYTPGDELDLAPEEAALFRPGVAGAQGAAGAAAAAASAQASGWVFEAEAAAE
jgi:hypothetical protein